MTIRTGGVGRPRRSLSLLRAETRSALLVPGGVTWGVSSASSASLLAMASRTLSASTVPGCASWSARQASIPMASIWAATQSTTGRPALECLRKDLGAGLRRLAHQRSHRAYGHDSTPEADMGYTYAILVACCLGYTLTQEREVGGRYA